MDALRARLLEAAKALLGEPNATFSFDLVAARAGVARSILQQQFRSQAGLLEALFDHLFVEARARERLSIATGASRDASGGSAPALRGGALTVDAYVAEIALLWDEQRTVIRRLRALAAFDSELARAFATRDEHRREGLLRLVRGGEERGVRPAPKAHELVERLFALTSFEAFDALAGPSRTIGSVVPIVQDLARAALR